MKYRVKITGFTFGVPPTFIVDNYNPEQFKIIGMAENEDLYGLKTRRYNAEECKAAYMFNHNKPGCLDLNASVAIAIGVGLKKVYTRLFIKFR